MMKRSGLILSIVAFALLFAGLAMADNIQTLTLVGVAGFNQNGYYDNPYYGSFDGGNSLFNMFCDDLLHEVNQGDQWQVNVINGAEASGARFFGSIGQQGYDMLFWLDTQYTAANYSSWGDISEAGWDIVNPGAFGGNALLWVASAEANWASINPSDFVILTPTDPNDGQEMTAPAPEPSGLLLLGSGILSLAAAARKRWL